MKFLSIKLSPVTEFSLSGTKLSGETPGQTTIKQSPILLVSASSIKAVAATQFSLAEAASATADAPCPQSLPTYKSDDCFASYIKAETSVVAQNTKLLNDWKAALGREKAKCKEGYCPGVANAQGMVAAYEYQVKCGTEFVNNLNALAGSCEAEKKKKCSEAGKDWVNNNCVPKCSGGQIRNADGKCECPAGQTMTVNGKCSSSCGAGSGIFGPIKNLWHNIKGETANCGENCFNPKTKCCLASKAVGEQCGAACYDPKTDCCADGKIEVGAKKCDGDCYDPKTECCVDGKKIPESCTCYHVGKRIESVEKFLAGYRQGKTLKQIDPTAITTAWTHCWPWPIGTWTNYSAGFKALDPEIQAGIKVHEMVHQQQCKDDEDAREIPAYEAELEFLESKFTEKCK